MRFLLSAIVVLGFQFSASASNDVPWPFGSPQWQDLVKKATASGDLMRMQDGTEVHYLSHIVPEDKKATHQSDYFSIFGSIDPQDGHFVPVNVSVVSETWTLAANGNWEIDQWIYEIDLNGALGSVAHSFLAEKQDGQVIDAHGLPTGTREEQLDRWNKQLELWNVWAQPLLSN